MYLLGWKPPHWPPSYQRVRTIVALVLLRWRNGLAQSSSHQLNACHGFVCRGQHKGRGWGGWCTRNLLEERLRWWDLWRGRPGFLHRLGWASWSGPWRAQWRGDWRKESQTHLLDTRLHVRCWRRGFCLHINRRCGGRWCILILVLRRWALLACFLVHLNLRGVVITHLRPGIMVQFLILDRFRLRFLLPRRWWRHGDRSGRGFSGFVSGGSRWGQGNSRQGGRVG